MEEATEPLRYFEQNWMIASGLDTLASASAESEPAHPASNETVSPSRPRKRRASDPDYFSKNSDSPLSNDDDVDKSTLPPEIFVADSARPRALSEFTTYAGSVPAPEPHPLVPPLALGKLSSAKSVPKTKATGKVARKAAALAKQESFPSAASPATLKKKKNTHADSDSSDSELSPRKDPSLSDSVPTPGISPNALQVEDVVIPQRALTVRERHRECNRLVARKTRVKKKIELDLLQSSFNDFRNFNDTLRSMLKAVVTREISSRILLDCNFQLPNNVVAIVAEMIAARECQQYVTNRQVDTLNRAFCITNPTVFDNPIAYASQDFGELTGYDTQSIIGYNCRFLQGADSDAREIYRLKVAVERGCNEQVVIRNYRRDGTGFWNLIHVMPVSDAYGKVFKVFSKNGDEMFWTKEPVPSPASTTSTTTSAASTGSTTGTGSSAGLAQGQRQGLDEGTGDAKHALTLDTNVSAHPDLPAPFSDQLSHLSKSSVSQLDSPLAAELKNGGDKSLMQIPSPEAMFRSWDSYGAFPSGEPPHTHGLHTSSAKQMGMGLGMGMALEIEKNTLYDNIHDRSPIRNSVVWDSWKYGTAETQKSFQMP